mmetsp:Transcript_31669/g.67471  ORF Transcript_31669/g.67471 Transcript_31669/m.67471 type:complete len:85 (+) Transcript_31669:394-648(+)
MPPTTRTMLVQHNTCAEENREKEEEYSRCGIALCHPRCCCSRSSTRARVCMHEGHTALPYTNEKVEDREAAFVVHMGDFIHECP